MVIPLSGNGIRAPGWFVAAVIAAAGLVGVGWWAATLRLADLDALRQQLARDHQEIERAADEILDSLTALRRVTRTNTARLCRIEARLKLPEHTLCEELYGPFERRPVR